MSAIRRYESEGLIHKSRMKDIILDAYINNHDESLALASKTYQRKESFLWVIVISYYSMFYLANAYIYKKGYKIGHRIAHR